MVFGCSGTDFGAHAEYKAINENEAIAHKPVNLSHAQAAGLCYEGLTALPFLRDIAQLKSGQTILINGASGSVGSSAIQLARIMGARVTGFAVPAISRGAIARRRSGYRLHREDFTRTGQTWDIIFDAVSKSSFTRSKNALAPQGIYLTTGLSLPIMLHMLRTARSPARRPSSPPPACVQPNRKTRTSSTSKASPNQSTHHPHRSQLPTSNKSPTPTATSNRNTKPATSSW